MKGILTLVLIYFFVSVMEGTSGNRNHNSRHNVQFKADSTSVKQNDSLPKNFININGQLNSVSISNNAPLAKNLDAKDMNTIKINGDSNSVNINQKIQSGNINIQQNGNGNQINVSQSKTKVIRQKE